MSFEALETQRRIWQAKPVLRKMYETYYERIVACCIPGETLEVGGGSGNLKQYRDRVVSTDLVQTPWIDAAADAQNLPFAEGAFANVVAIDVLHHIENPSLFLREALRVLQPAGCLILLEPAITPLSKVFYTYLHPEPVDMQDDPFAVRTPSPDRRPFDANQGIPTILFRRKLSDFRRHFPEVETAEVELSDLFVYPLSGGFRPWSLIPAVAVRPLLRLEGLLLGLLGSLMAFRMLVVLTKHV